MIATAVRLLVWFSILTGVAYPAAVTLLGRGLFHHRAMGSVIMVGGQPVGSELLAQKFSDPKYFQSRPSAGDPPFATVPSAASNLGPTSKALKKSIEERAAEVRAKFHPAPGTALPADLLTTSGSGLDPHVSPEAARLQIGSVAAARGFDAIRIRKLRELVETSIEPPQFGFLGESRVNVLALNVALDAMK